MFFDLPVQGLSGTQWIPACAGMTGLGEQIPGQDGIIKNPNRGFFIGLNSNLILFSFETLFRFELWIIWID